MEKGERKGRMVLSKEKMMLIGQKAAPGGKAQPRLRRMVAGVTDREALSNLTDFQLVSLAKQGNRSAFDELVLRHRRRCWIRANSILGNRSEAEEQTQIACWKAFEHIHQFQGKGEFANWLLRIVENQCLMLIRRKRLVPIVSINDQDGDRGIDSVPDKAPDADPEGDYGNREVLEVLRTEIRRIPTPLRNVIVMSDLEEVPMRVLAARLGITVTAAKSRLGRARVELRNRMQRHCARSGPSALFTRLPQQWESFTVRAFRPEGA